MPTLYVANTTKQRFDFTFRFPREDRPRRVTIPPGEQRMIHEKDMALPIMDLIIGQHARYGMIPASAIDQTRPFIGYCYQVDRPINVNKIMYADQHNQPVMDQASQDARAAEATVLANSMASRERDGVAPPMGLRGIELSAVQTNAPGEPGTNEKVTWHRDGPGKPLTNSRDDGGTAPTPRRGRGRPRKAVN